MNELIGKHTAILGSTGTGKSGAVAAILHSIVAHGKTNGYENWSPRIIIFDPHNEYGTAFEGQHVRLSTDEGSLKLPYWLFSLQETINLLIGKAEFVATSQANIIKIALLSLRQTSVAKLGLSKDDITVDSPVPYTLEDLEKEVKKGIGDNKQKKRALSGCFKQARSPSERRPHKVYDGFLEWRRRSAS